MRIKGKPSKGRKRPIQLLLPAGAVLVTVGLLLGLGGRGGSEEYFFCDMERTVNEGKNFRSNGVDFSNGKTRTDEYALSGKYAARCDMERKYGPGVTLHNVFSGDLIEAEVWRKSDFGIGPLAVQGMEGWKFSAYSKEPQKIVRGWELLEVKVTVPLGVENQMLKVFPYARQGVVYFDDLKVRRSKNPKPSISPSASYVAEKLNLQVDGKSMENFRQKRAEALSKAVLIAGDADLEKGKLHTADGEIDVQARLKGDLTDHLTGSKWSFRILAEGQKTWRGMPEFSVHNSLSRHHLDEWVYHQILEREDVLTTRYDFVEMALNGKTLGIYAYEEHFTPSLLRQRQRQVAPIIRWNEDGLWLNAGKGFGQRPPWFESAQIEAFQGKTVRKDNEQAAHFEAARNLLASAVEGTKKPSQIFDTQQLANFLAVTDLCLGHHSLNQTNLRFYFDPVTAKLQPVGYDGYTPNGTWAYPLPILTGAKFNSRTPWHFSSSNNYSPLHHLLFNDIAFAEKYAAAVERVTAPAYLDSLKFLLKNEIKARENFIRQEYTEYNFDFDYLTRNAAEIRKTLYPLENISLKAYHANGQLTLESYHPLPLEILGFGDTEIVVRPPERLLLESFNEAVPVRRYEVPLASKVKFIFCKTLGTSELAEIPVMRWAAPQTDAPAPAGATMGRLFTFDFVSVSNDGTIRTAPGRHVLERDLLVPPGRRLVVSAGTEFVLENGAGIVSQSPVEFIGTSDRPIRIVSESRTGQGLLVLQAGGQSIFQYVIFENLNARSRHGQRTEAAVAFYETEVQMKNCQFLNAQSKDALGFVRSEYELSDCRFENAAADGLDADFSAGNLSGLTFKKIGKDALEISGGTASIGEVQVAEAFGTGLNVTHHAIVSTKKIEVTDSEQGIVATDLAELTVDNLNLKNVKQGILAYQKLPEFGGSQIEVKKLEAENVGMLSQLEEGSAIKIEGEEVEKK